MWCETKTKNLTVVCTLCVNTEAPLRESSRSSRGDKQLKWNVRLILVEENCSNRWRHSPAAVVTGQLSTTPEREGLSRCPSRFTALLAPTHYRLWVGCVTVCVARYGPQNPTPNGLLLLEIENSDRCVFPVLAVL